MDSAAVKKLVAAATLFVLLLLPVVGAYVVVGESAAMGALIGGLVGFLTSITSGMALARRFVPVVVLTATASILTHDTWWWALGLAAVGALAGWFYRGGLFTPLVLCGLAYSVAQPVDGSGGLLAAAIFLVVGAGNGMVLAHALGAAESVDPVVRDTYPAWGTALALAITAGLSGVVALLWDNPNGYWLPMTVFIIAMPRPGVDLRARSRARVLGTVLGVVLAVVVVQFALPVGVPLVVAIVALLVAFTTESLTVSAAGSSMAIVLLLSPTGGGVDAAESRLAATVAAVVIGAVVLAVGHWAASRGGWLTADERIADRVQELAGQPADEGAGKP